MKILYVVYIWTWYRTNSMEYVANQANIRWFLKRTIVQNGIIKHKEFCGSAPQKNNHKLVKIIKIIFKVSENCPKDVQQMEKHLFKTFNSLLVKQGESGISATTCPLRHPQHHRSSTPVGCNQEQSLHHHTFWSRAMVSLQEKQTASMSS